MKKARLFTLLVALFALIACDPETPTDETKNKNHDDPYTMYIHLTAEGETPIKHTLSQKNDWASGELAVKSGTKYQLRIQYLDKEGEDITGQFATNGEDKIHQHFFLSNVRSLKIQDYILYQYADTTPWNKDVSEGAKLTAETNPIGLKGEITFLKPDSQFTLWITLLHDTGGDKRLTDGTFSKWHTLPKEKAYMAFDINVHIPIKVEK